MLSDGLTEHPFIFYLKNANIGALFIQPKITRRLKKLFRRPVINLLLIQGRKTADNTSSTEPILLPLSGLYIRSL
ncbi:hypothetical protein AKG43_10920 [Neisseria sp. 74A18]|nr:hypothetical protein AKG43_10920 [Neisseria sp. 74A18]